MANFTVHRDNKLGLLDQLAENGMIVDALQEAGFTDVSVEGSGPTRLAEATWPLEDASVPLPAQVVSVSEVEEA